MGKRTRARECAFQMLYQWQVTRAPIEDVIASFWRVRSTTPETAERAEGLARGAEREAGRLDEAIAAAAAHWRLERIAPVDRSILRLAAYELLREPRTPPAVVIDEAIELAKRFGEADSPAFVNGVLDAILRRARAGPGAGEAKGVREG